MSATHRGLIFTMLTGLTAGATATAWDERQMLLGISATAVLQVAAIACFLVGSRHRRTVAQDGRKNPLTPTPPVATMTAPHTDNKRTED